MQGSYRILKEERNCWETMGLPTALEGEGCLEQRCKNIEEVIIISKFTFLTMLL